MLDLQNAVGQGVLVIVGVHAYRGLQDNGAMVGLVVGLTFLFRQVAEPATPADEQVVDRVADAVVKEIKRQAPE